MKDKARLYELIKSGARMKEIVEVDNTMRLEEDLGYDSLTLIQLLVNIEDAFAFEIDDAKLIGLETVADIETICFGS